MANTRSDTSDILVRTNGMRDNTTTKAINRSSPKYFRLSRTLFSDSRIVVTIMMGLFFGSIQVSSSTSIASTYSGSLSSNSPVFLRPGQSSGYYCYQAIRVIVSTSGTYTFTSISSIDTYGCFYRDSVDPSYPSQNMITSDDDSNGNNQFQINVTLQSGRTYVLLVTTYSAAVIGSFSINVVGPASVSLSSFTPATSRPIRTTVATTTVVPSTYSGSLSSNSAVFLRPGGNSGYYYYQTIRVIVSTSGTYTFTSISAIDTYGYFYNDPIDPSYPSQNMITSDDDTNGNNQFRINVNLQSWGTYVLLVTTYSAAVTGRFSINVVGPGSASLSLFTPTTSRPIRTTVMTTAIIPSTYLSTLSSNSPVFLRPGGNSGYYYYQAIRVTVSTSGTYTFTSISSIDTYGYLYNEPVDPSYPSQNMIISDDDGGGGGQFRISINLQPARSYVLLVTTFSPAVTGSISIRVEGPVPASLSLFTPTTSRPIRTTRSPTDIWSTYSGSLSSSNPVFSRPEHTGDYYYQTIRVTVYTSGTYTFTSSSSIDTYGCFYNEPVDPSYPSQNLITSDDDGNGDRQFRIIGNLQSGSTYVLLVTTFRADVTGSFSIRVVGPASVGLSSFTPPGSRTKSTHRAWTIVGITVGCVILFVSILTVCVRKHKRAMITSQQTTSSARHQNRRVQNHPMTSTDRNGRQTDGLQVPYTIPMSSMYNTGMEAPPPSYDSILSKLPPQ